MATMKKYRILVVEDEESLLKLESILLSLRGYEVTGVTDGAAALAEIGRSRPDLIVLDIKLPDLTGWDLLAKIDADAALEFSGPVLVMTASIMDARVDLDRYPMVVEVLVKPFSAAKLVAAIEHALHVTLTHRT